MFLQLAIDHQPELHIVRRIIVFIILSDLYSIDGDTEESDRLAMEAILLFPNLTEFMSVTDLQQYHLDMHAIASFYQTHEKYDEATTIHTKQIQSYKNFPKNMNKHNFITAWKIAYSLYKEGNYSAAREIASIALNGYKDFSERDVVDRDVQRIYIQLQMLSGIVEFYIGNFSNGNAHLQSVISYIEDNNITHFYASELREACIRLVIKRQFHSCLGDILADAAMTMFYLMFSPQAGISYLEELLLVKGENSDETSFQDLVLSTDLSLSESHVTVLNQFVLYHRPYNYFNEFWLKYRMLGDVLLSIFSSRNVFCCISISLRFLIFWLCCYCLHRFDFIFRWIIYFAVVSMVCIIVALNYDFIE